MQNNSIPSKHQVYFGIFVTKYSIKTLISDRYWMNSGEARNINPKIPLTLLRKRGEI